MIIKQIDSSLFADMSFNVDKSSTTTINVSQPFTVLNQYEKCAASHNSPAFEAGIKITVDAKAHADVTYGIVAQGSIVPPKVTEFGLFADFDATLDGTLNVDALASVSGIYYTVCLGVQMTVILDLPSLRHCQSL